MSQSDYGKYMYPQDDLIDSDIALQKLEVSQIDDEFSSQPSQPVVTYSQRSQPISRSNVSLKPIQG
jgi:hypothetical protein